MRALSLLSKGFLTVVVLAVPTLASASSIEYTADIVVTNASNNTTLGYIGSNSTSPGYLFYTSALSSALTVTFTLDSGTTTASGVDLALDNFSPSGTGFGYLGLIEGRDDSSPTIASGSYNYLYVSATNATAPNSTPQAVGNIFNSNDGVSADSESAVWTVNLTTGALTPVWTNPNGTTPTTQLFTQSGALYAGGDPTAFFNRYPAPLTDVTYSLDILSQETISAATPEPSSWMLLLTGVLGAGILGYRSRLIAAGASLR